MADNTQDNAIVKKQKRDSAILQDYTSKCDAMIEKCDALMKSLKDYIKDDADEYEKQVARYDDVRQLMREVGGVSIRIKRFNDDIYDAIHTDGQDNVKKIHDLAKELHPAMNLASCTDSDATYEAIGGNPRQQWP